MRSHEFIAGTSLYIPSCKIITEVDMTHDVQSSIRESIIHDDPVTISDIKDVAIWMNTTSDKIHITHKHEPIEKFIGQIKEMYETFDEFPQDKRRTNKIIKIINAGSKPLPIYVDANDPHLFVMEGRHRMVAFWLLGMKTIPVAYVSVDINESSSGYIPSNSQKNDPRFKTALTKDVRPGTLKKNAKSFGFNISRAGIPKNANTNGKINENYVKDLTSDFLQSLSQHDLHLYSIRDNCGPAAIHMMLWAERTRGLNLQRVRGYFKTDYPVYDKRDFTQEQIIYMKNNGLDFNNKNDRKKFAENDSDMYYVPHYWLIDNNGNIYDPTAKMQFVDTGLTKDLNSDRYIENNNI